MQQISMQTVTPTFSKKERVASRKLMDTLFRPGNSKSMVAYPLRVVYRCQGRAEGDPPVQVLLSVSKRHFKRAVDRNRVKRQLREAYRHSKHLVWEPLAGREGEALVLAFIWLSDELKPSATVADSMARLLTRVAERVQR